ncbi:MAG: NTP transferase domain-containing protein [Candidatus Aenigmarchaeota archaeon]|nr:NTP transferase domain-containing protein [Candidatus Aenigmarchaeota archaeon]
MKVVVLMAGVGERFEKAGYKEPKPLVKVDGKPMIERVVNMFPGEEDFVFVCDNEHLRKTEMKRVLTSLKPNGLIVGINHQQLGAVWSMLEALKKIDFLKDDEPVIVTYCDFDVWWSYDDFKRKMVETKCDAAATAYKGFHPHLIGPQLYAGMRTDENNWMLECREKFSFTENKMDSYQQAGSFYFSSGALLKKYLLEVIKRGMIVNGEYYISVVTEAVRQDGHKVYVYPLEHFLQWGAPQDLQTYQFWSDYFKLKSNE